MTTEAKLRARAEDKCEFCGATENLAVHQVAPYDDGAPETCVLACTTCRAEIEGAGTPDAHHWRCLAESMWSATPAVQVVAWRMLGRLSAEDWARDLADQLYLDEETLAWAEMGHAPAAGDDGEAAAVHKDTYGAVLAAGDTVTLIKDLKVKGANFTAKRGTAVRNIALVPDNPTQIEGRVNDQRIVILTEFVKKSG